MCDEHNVDIVPQWTKDGKVHAYAVFACGVEPVREDLAHYESALIAGLEWIIEQREAK